MNSSNNIFQATACLSQEELIRYVKGEITKEEMRVVELHLADCEICFDAVEGLSQVEKSRLEKIQTELQDRIQKKLLTEEKQKVIPLYKKWYSMAAAIAVLFLFSVYLVRQFGQQENGLAESKNEPSSVTPKFEPKVTDETYKNDSITNNKVIQQNQGAIQNNNAAPVVAGDIDETKFKSEIAEAESNSGDVTLDDKPLADKKSNEVATTESLEKTVSPTITAPVNKPEQTKDATVYEEQSRSLRNIDTRVGNSYNDYDDKKLKSKRSSADVPAAGAATTALSATQAKNTTADFNFQLYDSALNYFNAKEYANSLNSFNQLLAKQPGNINSNYYAGISEYELQQYAQSINHLDKVIADKKNSFYESALWYKAQSLIKSDKKPEAKKTLETIVKYKGNYKKQAEELLKDL